MFYYKWHRNSKFFYVDLPKIHEMPAYEYANPVYLHCGISYHL